MPAFASALSQHPLATQATGEVAGAVLEELVGERPDLVVFFASPHHVGPFEDVTRALREILEPSVLLGATVASVIGRGREIEDTPALSVLAAVLPDARLTPWRPRVGRSPERATPDGDVDSGVEQELDAGVRDLADASDGATLVLLADPFTFPADGFLGRLAERAPGLRAAGGLASAAAGPGGNRLALDDAVVERSAVGVILDGGAEVRTVVSQGCRPLGRPFTITRAEGSLVLELGGRPALTRLQELVASVSDDERELVRRGLHVGLVVDEHKAEFGPGDFLVRNVLGADQRTGALLVGEHVTVGQTVQFHVRDAAAADDDLRAVLAAAATGGPTAGPGRVTADQVTADQIAAGQVAADQVTAEQKARAGLLFTCNGRGRHLFGTSDHDAQAVEACLGPLPVAGGFCAGEIGPVGSRSYLHGFTASLVLFG